jgi:hypothetical protein
MYQHFEGTCRLHLKGTKIPEDGSSMLFQNVGTYVPNYLAS